MSELVIRKRVKGGVLVCQGQLRRISMKNLHFPRFSPVFPPVPLKNWAILSLLTLLF